MMRKFRLERLLKLLEGQKPQEILAPSASRSREAVEMAYRKRFSTLDRAFEEIEDPFVPENLPNKPVAARIEVLPGRSLQLRRAEGRVYIENVDEQGRQDLS